MYHQRAAAPAAEALMARPNPSRKKQSARALAARRANLQKARQAPKEIIYRPTEKRMAASMANLERAYHARRRVHGSDRIRLNALKHGLYAHLTSESVERMGESPEAYQAHCERFRRLLAPRDPEEERLVARLADVTWRRLRLFHAQARREAGRLATLIAQASAQPAAEPLSAEETEWRGLLALAALDDWEGVKRDATRLTDEALECLKALGERRGEQDSGVGSQEPEKNNEL